MAWTTLCAPLFDCFFPSWELILVLLSSVIYNYRPQHPTKRSNCSAIAISRLLSQGNTLPYQHHDLRVYLESKYLYRCFPTQALTQAYPHFLQRNKVIYSSKGWEVRTLALKCQVQIMCRYFVKNTNYSHGGKTFSMFLAWYRRVFFVPFLQLHITDAEKTLISRWISYLAPAKAKSYSSFQAS